MASSDPGGPALDLYQLLGVPRDISQEEIALAWRRRARREHPDTRPARQVDSRDNEDVRLALLAALALRYLAWDRGRPW